MLTFEEMMSKACNEFGLVADFGFVADIGGGRVVRSIVRVRNLGGKNGMLVVGSGNDVGQLSEEISKAGFGYSVLDDGPCPDEMFDLESFRELFLDWGWSGLEADRPSSLGRKRYILVVQWPAGLLKDRDSLIDAEEALIDGLTDVHKVYGYDLGSRETNIFVGTDDFEKAFDEAKAILVAEGLWSNVRLAYREIDKSQYVKLWPNGLENFEIENDYE